MSDWILIACLVTLRGEYNQINPHRDKGADGSIGDAKHSPSSDHSPDEDSIVLRARDADGVNEVHAIDIDSTGAWPYPGWFDASVKAIVDRHRKGLDNRLQYVIWDGQIANADIANWTWRPFHGKDPHHDHAHFSARYTTAQETDTRPWGVLDQEDDMPSAQEIAAAVWAHRIQAPPEVLKDSPRAEWTAGSYLTSGRANGRGAWLAVNAAAAQLAGLAAAVSRTTDDADKAEILGTIKAQADRLAAATALVPEQTLAGLDAQAIAAAIPAELARQVADELARRLTA